MKHAALLLLLVLAALLLLTPPSPAVMIIGRDHYVGRGVMRWNQHSQYHLIIGYDALNCSILAPSDYNVIGDVVVEMSGPGTAITIGESASLVTRGATIRLGNTQ